jgi:cyclase
MFSPRVIPVLLFKNSGLVKSVRFKNYTYIGDPINAVRIFNESFADEIIILDIEASRKGRAIDLQLVKEVGEEANMPFAVGGGIDTLQKIYDRLKSGAEKVILNAAALKNTDFVREAADQFGSSTIAVCVDIKKNIFGRYQVYNHQEQKSLDRSFLDYIRQIENCGAGEIIVQSVDNDGLLKGYDTRLYDALSREINVPIVALGGAGSVEDMQQLWRSTAVNSFAAGSLFVYYGPMKGVLINYPQINRNEFREKFKI